MKKTTTVCNHCKKEVDYIPTSWLSIWTQDGNNTLCMQNDFKNRAICSMRSHDEINFCSAKCFINFFIKTAGVFTPEDTPPEQDHREEE